MIPWYPNIVLKSLCAEDSRQHHPKYFLASAIDEKQEGQRTIHNERWRKCSIDIIKFRPFLWGQLRTFMQHNAAKHVTWAQQSFDWIPCLCPRWIWARRISRTLQCFSTTPQGTQWVDSASQVRRDSWCKIGYLLWAYFKMHRTPDEWKERFGWRESYWRREQRARDDFKSCQRHSMNSVCEHSKGSVAIYPQYRCAYLLLMLHNAIHIFCTESNVLILLRSKGNSFCSCIYFPSISVWGTVNLCNTRNGVNKSLWATLSNVYSG